MALSAATQLLACESDRLAEEEPGPDAALVALRSVVIKDALHPVAADLAVGTVRQDGGVLHRDRRLVVEAVGDPALDRRAVEAPLPRLA
jgi:hypothetical protein